MQRRTLQHGMHCGSSRSLHGAVMAHWCGSTSEQRSVRAHTLGYKHCQRWACAVLYDGASWYAESAVRRLCWQVQEFAAAVHAVLLYQLLLATALFMFEVCYMCSWCTC
jgi:hypothetical protein